MNFKNYFCHLSKAKSILLIACLLMGSLVYAAPTRTGIPGVDTWLGDLEKFGEPTPTKKDIRDMDRWLNEIVTDDNKRNDLWNGPLTSKRFREKMDFVTDSVLTSGNQAQLLLNGMMAYKARYQLMDIAKKSIVMVCLSIYARENSNADPSSLERIDDSLTREMVRKLIAAKKRGVEVKLLYDGATAVFSGTLVAVNFLRKAGIEVIKYNPVVGNGSNNVGLYFPIAAFNLIRKSAFFNRWHEKTLVVDGKYAITGGLNWGEMYGYGNNYSAAIYSPEYFYGNELVKEIGIKPFSSWGKRKSIGWRDSDILLKGPVVREIQTTLLKDFLLLKDRIGSGMTNPWGKVKDESFFKRAENNFKYLYENNLKYFPAESLEGDGPGLKIRYVHHRPYLHKRWKKWQKIRKEANARGGIFVSKQAPQAAISSYYVNAINKAQHQILWGSHSNKPHPEMLEALRQAAARGVKIYITGNSPEAAATLSEKGIYMYPRAVCQYKVLLEAGKGNIRIFEWQRRVQFTDKAGVYHDLQSGCFHSKIFVVDGILTSIGSYNLAPASFRKHTEGTAVIVDREFAKKAQTMYAKDLFFTNEVTPEYSQKQFDRYCGGNRDDGDVFLSNIN